MNPRGQNQNYFCKEQILMLLYWATLILKYHCKYMFRNAFHGNSIFQILLNRNIIQLLFWILLDAFPSIEKFNKIYIKHTDFGLKDKRTSKYLNLIFIYSFHLLCIPVLYRKVKCIWWHSAKTHDFPMYPVFWMTCHNVLEKRHMN